MEMFLVQQGLIQGPALFSTFIEDWKANIKALLLKFAGDTWTGKRINDDGWVHA